MRWRTFAVSALVTWATGCQAQPRLLYGDEAAAGVGALGRRRLGRRRRGGPFAKAGCRPARTLVLNNYLDQAPKRQDTGDKGIVKARIQATVNGNPILQEEVMEASYPIILGLQSKGVPASELDNAVAAIYSKQLEELIDYELLFEDAYTKLSRGGHQQLDKLRQAASHEFDQIMRKKRLDMGIKTEQEFRQVLESHQVSLEGMRKQYLRTYLAKEYLRYLVSTRIDDAVGHRQIREYYESHPEEFIAFDNVEWFDLFIDPSNARFKGNRDEARSFAQQLVTLLRQGTDIKQFFEYDNGDSKTREGHGMGPRKGEIQPSEAEALLFQMHDNDIADVLEVPGGFHVIKLAKREYAGPRPFNEIVQSEIKDKLRGEIGGREIKAILRELRGQAVIEYADKAK